MQTRKGLKLVVLTFITAVILGMGVTALASPQVLRRQLDAVFTGVSVVLDGRTIDLRDATGREVEPFIVDGTTYLPVRAVAEALGLPVEWDPHTQTVYLGRRMQQVSDFRDLLQYRGDGLTLGSGRFLVRGVEQPADPTGFQFRDDWRFDNRRGRYSRHYVAPSNGRTSDFNLNASYSRLTATGILAEEQHTTRRAIVRFYGDGALLGEFTLVPHEFTNIDIPLIGVHTLRVVRYGGYGPRPDTPTIHTFRGITSQGSTGVINNVRIYSVG